MEYPWGDIGPEREARVAQQFPWREQSPEEYAARNGHHILVFAYHLHRFSELALQEWIQRLHEILASEPLMSQARDQYLGDEERARVEAEIIAQNKAFEDPGEAPSIGKPLISRDDSRSWWARRRGQYNLALVAAGAAAFLLLDCLDPEFWEGGLISLFLQGIGYLFMMGVANLCYNLGPLVDRVFTRCDSEGFRRLLFNLGLGFSVVLPLTLPLTFAVMRIHFPAPDPTVADVVGTWRSNHTFKGMPVGVDLINIYPDGTYEHISTSGFPGPAATHEKPDIGTWKLAAHGGGFLLTFDQFVWTSEEGVEDQHADSGPGPWSVSVDRALVGPLRLYFNTGREYYFAKARSNG